MDKCIRTKEKLTIKDCKALFKQCTVKGDTAMATKLLEVMEQKLLCIG
jgi:hypothetical protein